MLQTISLNPDLGASWSPTCGPSPPRDAAGVVRLKEVGGPGNADGSNGRVFLQTRVLEGKRLQLHQSDVVLVGAGVVPAGRHRSVKACLYVRV